MNGRLLIVSSAGAAGGSRAAAAGLACAGSEPDRPGLLIDVGGRRPRPTLVASAGARELEERLAAHLPQLPAASRGETCHLAVTADSEGLECLSAALPLVRDSIAVAHVDPADFRRLLELPHVAPGGVLICADLTVDRALTALVVRDLLARDLPVKVLKRPLAWVPSRRALFGVLPGHSPAGLPACIRRSLLEGRI